MSPCQGKRLSQFAITSLRASDPRPRDRYLYPDRWMHFPSSYRPINLRSLAKSQRGWRSSPNIIIFYQYATPFPKHGYWHQLGRVTEHFAPNLNCGRLDSRRSIEPGMTVIIKVIQSYLSESESLRDSTDRLWRSLRLHPFTLLFGIFWVDILSYPKVLKPST